MAPENSLHCFERLTQRVESRGNSLCIGIDPHVDQLTGFFEKERDRDAPEFLKNFSTSLIDVAAEKCSSVKFQSAFFERYGAEGFGALKESISYAKSQGLVVILDAKRGDISSTMAAYGDMAFGYFDADILTVLPYMGVGVLTPLKKWFDAGRGVYQVWISSNPDGLLLQKEIAGLLLDETQQWSKKQQVSLEQIGLVLGATKVSTLSPTLLEQAKEFHLLLPGFGAQGAKTSDALAQLQRLAPSCLLPISRGIAGIGLADEAAALAAVRDWRSYQKYCAKRFEMMEI